MSQDNKVAIAIVVIYGLFVFVGWLTGGWDPSSDREDRDDKS